MSAAESKLAFASMNSGRSSSSSSLFFLPQAFSCSGCPAWIRRL
jgi:hypothetical protein